MVKEISNKSLASLLVIAIAVSVLGTLISLDKISGLHGITGATTDTKTGGVNVTISSATAVNFSGYAGMNFGTGYVNSGSTKCSLSSLGNSGSCTGFSTKSHWNITNTGNENVNLSVTQTLTEATIGGGATYKFKVAEHGTDCKTALRPLAFNTTVPGSSKYTLCNNFTSQDAVDYLLFDINITITETSACATGCTDTWTFNAAAV